ncbi:type II/IV secretion system protein [Candidatus Saccharibacteria bacterium]|nr:type II/IV secretion system protein [Candidatus Saccharibacteria bacterium]MBQ1539975.1 type II/IV secretion system protein [Candidatus Saccharibacteria bacterium]
MALLTKEAENKISALLVAEGLADGNLVNSVSSEVPVDQSVLAELIKRGVINDSMVARATATLINVPYVELKNVAIDQDVLMLIPQEAQSRVLAIPLGDKDGVLNVAMADVTNVQATDYLSSLVNRPIRVWMSSESGIREMIEKNHGDFSGVTEAVRETNAEEAAGEQKDVKTIVQDSPISKALTTILSYAAKTKASDIHIEPLEGSLIIRCRIDGVLRKIMDLPKNVAPALVSRIKILSNLKIDEHRIPQDGQFTVLVDDKEIDLRIAISPVTWGEQVVIRLLDKSGMTMDIEKMGMSGRALRTVLEGIKKPNGMILTSGPTGSGKSTTLYALIQQIKSEAINIVTLEDPVEYKMDGINQIQVNVDAGLTFASGLRSILRQDPDVVMVGEIRDSETAGLAVQAALTGHLVFSTLHTNSAAGILPRLLDMGIEPFLLASTLNVVIGQRLVRRITEKRETYKSSEIETSSINDLIGDLLPKTDADVAKVSEDLGYPGLPVKNDKYYMLSKGMATKETPGGYKGRAGLYETIEVDEDIQKLIISHATSAEIMRLAKSKGTVTMRQDGMLKVLSGITTIEEVNRVASDLT